MGLFDDLKELAGFPDLGMSNLKTKLGLSDTTNESHIQNQQTQIPQQQTNPVGGNLYDPKLEKLIELALVDGELTEKEKQVLFKKAESMGIDLDEFEMVLDARLQQANRINQKQTPQSSAPQSNKYGDVKKCPACGAMIESFTARCPTCGHEFSNIAANSSIQKLFDMLNEVEESSKEDASSLLSGIGQFYGKALSQAFGGDKDTRRKKAIIQNFPIPTTKDDILEFLAQAVPLARKPGFFSQDEMAKEMYPVWKAKCEQIIMKAKFSMRDDKKTLEMIKEYADELKIKM